MRGLTGKVVLVTGAAGGIGTSLVQRFLEEGSKVAACDLNEQGLAQLKEKFSEYATQLMLIKLDITDHAAVAQAAKDIKAQFNQIDVLVNNAGWDVAKQFVDTTPDFWEKVVSINLMGPLNLQHVIVPAMIANGGGKIINISSDAG